MLADDAVMSNKIEEAMENEQCYPDKEDELFQPVGVFKNPHKADQDEMKSKFKNKDDAAFNIWSTTLMNHWHYDNLDIIFEQNICHSRNAN